MANNSSNSSMGVFGNTELQKPKQPSGVLKYCFTLNNYKSKEIDNITEYLKKFCKKFLFQTEIGLEDTDHLQGSFWLKKKMRITEFKRWPHGLGGAHYEAMRDEQASEEYCEKDDGTFLFFPAGRKIKFGFPAVIKCISTLYEWQKNVEIKSIMEPDGRTINWIYETEGGVGKSAFCKYMYMKHNALVIQGGKLADIMNIIFNTDMDKVNTMFIDVPRTNGNKVSYNAIECILNGMITNTKYETGIKVFNPPNIFVFSNFLPMVDNLSQDRWKIFNIKNNILEIVNLQELLSLDI